MELASTSLVRVHLPLLRGMVLAGVTIRPVIGSEAASSAAAKGRRRPQVACPAKVGLDTGRVRSGIIAPQKPQPQPPLVRRVGVRRHGVGPDTSHLRWQGSVCSRSIGLSLQATP